jgi:hypothetical protein
MSALTLMIIRHAERPDGDELGPGLTETGQQDDKSLVVRGWQRAGAWAALFGTGLGGADYPKPDKIFAATPGAGAADDGPSRRPFETVSALAARLEQDTKAKFAQGQEAELMEKVLGLSGVVLVAWEHKAIINDILPKIPVSHGSPPKRWSGERFDVVLRFDRPAGASTFSYRPLYPRLLSGDLATPVDARAG